MAAASPSEEKPDPARSHVAPPPGSRDALAAGCVCSVLANAGYRTGADPAPLVDPACPLEHR